MGKLYEYFGVVGIASIVAWAAALLLLAAFARSRMRTRAWLAAFALALLAFVLAKVNSHYIGQFETERSPASAGGGKRESGESGESRPLGDDSRDSQDSRFAHAQPAYREAGKQKRDEGAKIERPELATVSEKPHAVPSARRLPEADIIAADRLDRLNLFAARLVPWLALLALAFDYLSRLNRTLGCAFPLPIAGRTLDALFPKTHSVLLSTPEAEATRHYLEQLVRKGETFIYFGTADPWEADALPRLPGAFGANLWPVRKLRHGGQGVPADPRFVFDAAWFGRYCFVVTDPEAATALMAQLADYLDARRIPRASAPRTVHIVWDLPPPLPARSPQEWASLCREANFKLTVVAASAPAHDWADAASAFEERLALPSGAKGV